MTDSEYGWLLAGMVVVTVVPRVLPQWIWREGAGGRFVQAALGLVPFAVLGALLVPGMWTGMAHTPPAATLAGAAAAIWFAWRDVNVVLVVLTAIGVHLAVSIGIGA